MNQNQTTDPSPRLGQYFLLLGILWVITFLTFAPALQNGFLVGLDDGTHLVLNPDVQSLSISHIKNIFAHSLINGIYIPLTILSFAVEYHFWGYQPFVYHFDNLGLYMLVVGLVFSFFRQLGLGATAAFWGALLFSVHPMHVESLAWVTERKDVLYAFFYMLALCVYLRYLRQPRWIYYLLSIGFGFLSMLAKPMALSLPLILLLCDWYVGRKMTPRVFLEKIPWFLYIIPLSLITGQAWAEKMPGVQWQESILVWIWSFSFYLQKFLFPVILNPVYPTPEPVRFWEIPYVLSVLVFLLTLLGLVRYRKNKNLVFAFLFYFLSIFFILRLNKNFSINLVADRYMFLPCIGICLFFADALVRLLHGFLKKKGQALFGIGYGLVGLLFLGLCVKSFNQTKVWHDSFVFWNHVARYNPTSAYVVYSRAIQNQMRGNWDLALQDYQKVIALDPGHYEAYNGRGMIYKRLGRYDLAMKDFNKTLELAPKYFYAHYNRGELYLYSKQYQFALADFNKVVEINPDLMGGYYRRGSLCRILGQDDLALVDFNRALAINPHYAPAYLERSKIYFKKGEMQRAMKDALQARALGLIEEDYFENLVAEYNHR